MDIGQSSRWSKGELELIKNLFKGNDGEERLYQIRNILWGFQDGGILLNKDALEIVEKMVLPNLTSEVPFGQQADLYFSLSNIKEIHPEVGALHIQARDKATEYLKQRIEILKGNKVENGMLLDNLKSGEDKKFGDERVIDMLAYLFLTNSFIDSCMVQLKTLANQEEKSEEEMKLKAQKDSSK